MRRLLALLLACAALAVAVAGCGGGDDNDSGGSGGGGGNADTTDPPAPKAEDNGDDTNAGGPQVLMKDIKFNPGSLKVKAGQTVTWTNDDSVGHDVTGDAFQSGVPGGIEPGNTFTHKFPKAGTYAYVCSVHPGMKGTIKVTR
jgi:plastocyanin